MSDKHVRIVIPSEEDDLPDERVWALPHASIPNVYRIGNVPVSPFGIAYKDWVECTPTKRKNGVSRVKHVYQSGGYGMVFVRINDKSVTRAADFFAIIDAMEVLQWPLESMRDGYWMIVAVPPGQHAAAETLFKQHPGADFSWAREPLSYDPMQHPAALPMSIKTLTEAWTALTTSFQHSSYSPHDDFSDETRAALSQLETLLKPLMGEDQSS